MKKLFICFIFGSALLIAGCSGSVSDSSDPEKFIVSYLKNINTLSAEKLASLFSKKSLVYENYSAEDALKSSKKLVNGIKFSESEIEAVKIDDVYNYDEDTVITYVTYKLKIGSKNSPEMIHDFFVLSKEGNRWKININNIVTKYDYSDSCGESTPIKLCITKAVIYPENTVIEGAIENSSQDTYSFGFASPAPTLINLLNKTTVEGAFPSIHNGQSQNTIPPGKQEIKLFFGSELNPLLLKSMPIFLAVGQLKKLGWGGLPDMHGESGQINVRLSQSQ